MKTTLFKAKKIKRSRKHGFFARMQTRQGRAVITRRRRRGRSKLTV